MRAALRWLLACAAPAVAGAAGCAHACPAPLGPKPRQWIELAAGVADLQAPRDAIADDGLALGISGGVDFLQGPPDVGFDLGVVGSRHRLADALVDPGEHYEYLDVFRFYGGLRATTDLGELPFSAYLRGGWFFRSEHDRSDSGLGDDGWGTYAGAGLEYMVEPNGRFGPFVMYQRDGDGSLEEWLFGFSARFYFDD